MKIEILVYPHLVINIIHLFFMYIFSRSEEDFKEPKHFHYDLHSHALAQEHLPRGSGIILVERLELKLFTITTMYILSLSDLYRGVEKKIFQRNNACSLYDIYGHPSTRISDPRS